MKLLEYQAKELFARYGLPVQRGVVLSERGGTATAIKAAGLRYPVVLKAQIQAGGRGKAGGICFAENGEEAQAIADALLVSELKDYRVNQLLAVEKAEIVGEWYLSIILDRNIQSPLIIFSTKGGVDIEQTAVNDPDAVVRLPVNPLTGITGYTTRYLCSRCGVPDGQADVLKEVLEKLYALFMGCGCLTAEINPLATLPDGGLLALDGKVELDDDALYRLPEAQSWRDAMPEHPLISRARRERFLYIPLTPGGRVAVMSNGSGMLMSTIDLLSKRGIPAACGLDLGGGATSDRIREAVRIVLETEGVDTL